jgi:hypothetical protein
VDGLHPIVECGINGTEHLCSATTVFVGYVFTDENGCYATRLQMSPVVPT